MSSTPVATAVQAQVGFGSVTIGWTDAAQHDRYVYVETADPDGTHTEVKVFGGNGLTTGTRVVSIARPYRQPSVCVRIWAAELLPGLTGSLPGPDFSDSSPMNAVINPSPRVCFETPGI